MAAIQIIDFEDIYTAVLGLLKIQASDTTTLNRIKRDINACYANLVSRKPWWWNRSLLQLQTAKKQVTGTIAITEGSTAITFSVAPTVSLADYKISIGGFAEILTISSHSALSTSATLSVPFLGATVTAASFKAYNDYVLLPTDCKETTMVQHQHANQPMIGVGLQDFRRIVAAEPLREGTPVYYTTDDFTASGKRKLRFWPALSATGVTLDVDYSMNFVGLDLDGDEPIMPIEDRIVLYYYGAAEAWSRERNPEESNRYLQLAEIKFNDMASHITDSVQQPKMSLSVGYMAQKRAKRRRGSGF